MRGLLKTFSVNERGATAIIVGIAAPILFGFGALAIDGAMGRQVQARLQTAGDAAALAAVQRLPDTAAATAAALDLAAKNVPPDYGTVLTSSDIVFGTYDPDEQVFTPTTTGANAVRIKTGRLAANGNSLSTTFGWAVGRSSLDVSTASTAYRSAGPLNCVFVLGGGNSALDASGSGKLEVPNCGVQVNSGHPVGARTWGSSSVAAKSLSFVGGYQGNFSPAPVTGSPALPDPLANIPEPIPPSGCGSLTASPTPNQTYCNVINISTNLTLPPGIYYFRNATVTVSGSVNVIGNEVMLFFDANSSLSLASSGTVNITAPKSGTYKGISVFQSRSAPLNNPGISLTGSADFLLDGTIYVPRANLRLWGSSSITTAPKSGYVISNQLTFGGSSDFRVGAWGGTQALGKPQKAALVN